MLFVKVELTKQSVERVLNCIISRHLLLPLKIRLILQLPLRIWGESLCVNSKCSYEVFKVDDNHHTSDPQFLPSTTPLALKTFPSMAISKCISPSIHNLMFHISNMVCPSLLCITIIKFLILGNVYKKRKNPSNQIYISTLLYSKYISTLRTKEAY